MRTRTKDRKTTVVGSHHWYNLSSSGPPSTENRIIDLHNKTVCRDSLSPKPFTKANPFYLEREKEGVVRVSGHVTHRILGFEVSKDQYSSFPLEKVVPSFGINSIVPMSTYTTSALARAMPNQSQTDLAETLLQLPQLKGSVLQLRKLFLELRNKKFRASTIGGAYIANEFGIRPLIRDLWNSISIADQLNNASKAYNKAEKGTSLKGTLLQEKDEWKDISWLNTSWSLHKFSLLNKYSNRVWYSVRFQPNGYKAPTTEAKTFEYFGTDKPLNSLWNLVPWSFLVDYVVDVSSFLESRNSSHQVKDICIMRHRKANKSLGGPGDITTFGLYAIQELDLEFYVRDAFIEHKERKVYAGTVGMPVKLFLTAKQSSNLLGLLAANSKGRSRLA